MSVTKIFLCAGHGGGSPGATWHGRQEATETIKLVDAVYKRVKPHMPADHDLVKVPHSLDYKNGADWIYARYNPKTDIVIDFHFNAFHDQRASGTETLFGLRNLAERVQRNVVKHLGLKDRGVKARTDLYILRKMPTGAALLESCFLSNKTNMAVFDQKGVEAVSNAIYSAVVAKDTTVPQPKPPVPDPEPPVPSVSEPAKLPKPVVFKTRSVNGIPARLIDARTNKVVKEYEDGHEWVAYASFGYNGVAFYQTEYSFNAKSWTGVQQGFLVSEEVPQKPEVPSEETQDEQIAETAKMLEELTERVTNIERLLRGIGELFGAFINTFRRN